MLRDPREPFQSIRLYKVIITNTSDPKSTRTLKAHTGNFISTASSFLLRSQVFNISPREARSMDPQQWVLPTTYDALENAGYVPDATPSFRKEGIGCWVGLRPLSTPHILLRSSQYGLDRGHFLSPTGQCKAFNTSADGYSSSEGCGMFALKRLSDAIAENNIVGIIRGVEMNQSGLAHSITNPPTQTALFNQLLENAFNAHKCGRGTWYWHSDWRSSGVEDHHFWVIHLTNSLEGFPTRSGRPVDESLIIVAILFLMELDSFRVVLLPPPLLLCSRLVSVVRGHMCDTLLSFLNESTHDFSEFRAAQSLRSSAEPMLSAN
ncbi:hypothetical protein PILCRDRAFT_14952 [Piloderma croceum F 1598]|uniref:Ketosynthase family 3 (KS3) domain-containing protein n=1 Tax=Piloderma croceum (strain F 1598) TaxID=765440 RepID=A0A0C3EMK1_PILCF|nr:hypothetical protein PILCRDRAFT_14952 [Piloderma croceum F 1598]